MLRTWTAVDHWFSARLSLEDSALRAAQESSVAAGLPDIAVTPSQGRLLWMLAKLCGARRILEIGTLGGYSTIWLARALPVDGKLISLELLEKHASIARENIARAGLAPRVEVRVAPAIESLAKLEAERAGPFDLTFIDADKERSQEYFAAALRMSRPGSLIVVDNVVREGEVIDPASTDERVRGIQKLVDSIATESRVHATVIQTVGTKGYDGLLVAMVS